MVMRSQWQPKLSGRILPLKTAKMAALNILNYFNNIQELTIEKKHQISASKKGKRKNSELCLL